MAKSKNKFLAAICAFLLFISCLLSSTNSISVFAESETQTVRVGFFAFDGYHNQDENGNRSGYGYEILQRMAGYAGLKYEYVGYDKSWSEMQEMLLDGEIDILTSAQKTPEREALFDFSESSIGTSSAVLTTKKGNDTYVYSDYDCWSGMRVGMIEGNSRNDSFRDFALVHNFTYIPVYYTDTEKMVSDLQAGEIIDAVLTSNLRRRENEWTLAQFASSPFYVMVKKGNTALLDKINYAISQIDIYESGFRTKLMSTYYATTSGEDIAYSVEERQFITMNKNVTYNAVINPDRAPYSNIKDGIYSGILYEIATEIIKRSGINVVFLEANNRSDYWRIVSEGTADIRFDADYNYNKSEQNSYWLTPSYLSVSVARLFRKDKTSFSSAAMISYSNIFQSYADNLREQGIVVTGYSSASAVVDAVMTGKCDMALLPIGSASLAVRNDATNRLISEEMYGYNTSYSVAINTRNNSTLYSIFKKAAASISNAETDAVLQSYADEFEKPFSFIGYIYDYPLHIVVIVAAILLVAFLLLYLYMLSKKRKAALIQVENEKRRNNLLNDALAQAERADAAKSQFLSRVSHEMRTPLNAIIGFIELSRDADKNAITEYLANSDMAAKQLLSVINDVLDMSSIESGKLKIAHASFDFKKLISAITNIFDIQCKQKNLTFDTKISSFTDEWLIGDEMRTNQILMNLLGNAVKFTENGGISLSVSQTVTEGNKVFVRFVVSDTGCGMSTEMQERLFKPFEQENADTARRYGGSGLGLSIVKNLVTMMGGTVRAESELGRGTTFTVDVPYEKNNEGGEKLAAEEVVEEKVDIIFINRRVLLAEDNKLNRMIMERYLERIGIACECVINGQLALDKFLASPVGYYDAILMDIQMPVMNGFEATKAIRESAHPEAKTIQIIAQTADAFNEDITKALSMGMNAHITKPIKPELLTKTLSYAFAVRDRTD